MGARTMCLSTFQMLLRLVDGRAVLSQSAMEVSIGGGDGPRVFKPKHFCNSLITWNLLLFPAGTDSIYKSYKVEMEKAIVS